MAIVGDILALTALGNAGMALLGALLGFSRRRLARWLTGSIAAIVVTSVALAANGFIFGLSNVTLIAVLFGAAILTIGALTLTALRGAVVR